jgi:hypothetical protein
MRQMLHLCTTMLIAILPTATVGAATDLAKVPFFDCDRSGMLNTWGGPLEAGTLRGIELQSKHVHSGQRALALDLGQMKAGESRYMRCLASGFGSAPGYSQSRDLTNYERIEFWAQNATGTALRCALKLKDYRSSDEHQAAYEFPLPDKPDWVHIAIPLDFAKSAWKRLGDPELSRVLAIDFVFGPASPARASGRIYLDEVDFVDRGGALDIDTAPLPAIVERLVRRQWQAMWAARCRAHGMMPNNSYQSTDAGTNTTAAMLWMLPAAINHQWLTQSESDAYVTLLTQTINRLLDQAKYLPPRNVDWVTLKPSLLPEESSVDAAFLALAMHRYKTLPTTSAKLRKVIDDTENRFDFAAFGCTAGWRMAYRYSAGHSPEGFTPFTYDGYTNEGNLVSLAAHLTGRRHVPIETYWNTTSLRVRAGSSTPDRAPVVHSLAEFRAPFSQALWNLFVDVRQRGPDKYPDGRLAVNPWDNFVCYEQNVMNVLAARGRTGLVQPDAGDDGTLTNYRQFSAYDDFGQSDLFMPWSVSFAVLARVDGSDAALRHLLRNRLYGPFGLADSAKWATGAPKPYAVTARQDFWNTSLATMAFLEYLDSDARQSKSFAALPDVSTALDQVFRSLPANHSELTRSAATVPHR